MGKYLKKFELTSQYEEYINSTMALLPNVSLTNDDNMVHYNPYIVPNYLKFTAEEDNSTISLSSGTDPDIKYSLNDGDWTQWDYSAITLNTGDTVRMKGNNSNGFSTSSSSYNQFQMTGKIGASGNIMSLLYDDDFEGKLIIPSSYCYNRMFNGCTSLTTAPELPATTLSEGCYSRMFYYCTSLITAPELPATELVDDCYEGMFVECTSLTTAPELPATTLADNCYSSMFRVCTKLNYIKMLATDISASYCLYNWVAGVASTGTFVKHPDMTSLPTGSDGIPTGWNINIEMDYKKSSIINNSNNNEIIFHYNDGIYSSIKGNHIDLSEQYDENTIYSFTPEINLIINIYKVSQDNVGVLKSANVTWESATSLEELCGTYNINDLDGILIIIKSVDDNYNDGYDYYDYNPYENQYFTIENINSYDGTLRININDNYHTSIENLSYNIDNSGWNDISSDSNITVTVPAGKTIQFKCNYIGTIDWSSYAALKIYNNIDFNYNVYGNIMSLIEGDNFKSASKDLSEYGTDIFKEFFAYDTHLISAKNLILPATTLARGCYRYMFYGCTSLTTAPELHATTLATECYYYMFAVCTSLTTSPELPATTLANGCYESMFQDCTSLTTAPVLPATTLAEKCYYNMFFDCTSLNHIKMLATDISASNCLNGWVNNVASTGTFVKHPNMTSLSTGTSGIPSGWTVQDAA